MIYFISDGSQKNIKETDEIKVVDGLNIVLDWLENKPFNSDIDFDLETTELDPYKAEVILWVIGDEQIQFVIDNSCDYPIAKIFEYQSKFVWRGQNIKFDYKFLLVKLGIKLGRLYDTMIADQRLFQGSGYKFGLEELCKRHLGFIPDGMDENITMTFVGYNLKHKTLSNRQIKYAAVDIKYLKDIKEKQAWFIDKFNMSFLIHQVEFPLIRVLAHSELEGLKLDIPKWRVLIVKQEKIVKETQHKLDELIVKYRDEFFERESENWMALNGGKFTRTRNEPEKVKQIDIFGETTNIVASQKKTHFNYDSPTQILDLFARLDEPLPTDKGEYLIPKFNAKNKIDKDFAISLEGVVVPLTKFTTIEGALDLYLLERPISKVKDFIKTLIDYREAETALSSFGEGFIEKINPITGHIHTIYRQCNSETGRLQSGGGKRETDKINGQNMKRDKEYRECFTVDDVENYDVITCDLSGAEVTIMCDKANDAQLFEWAVKQDDAHSPIAQVCWRNIFLYRAGKKIGQWSNSKEFFNLRVNVLAISAIEIATLTDEEIRKDYVNSQTYVVSKKVNKDIRTIFKNGTFAITYGVFPPKLAKMLNIEVDEAEVVINTMKITIPDTFKMIERNQEFVLGPKDWRGYRTSPNNPYLIIDGRSNARTWFMEIRAAKKTGDSLTFGSISDIEKSCANYPIQGTQANMLKEAMVDISNTIEEQEIDANLLLNVHDELVYRAHINAVATYYDEELNKELTIPFKEYVPKAMNQAANKYLNHFKMSSEVEVKKCWTK